MRPIPVASRQLSMAFWGSLKKFGYGPVEAYQRCEKNRDLSSIDTGTITQEDAVTLFRLARGFMPAVVAEVGTYIGTSTVALKVGSGGQVYTCDRLNDCFAMEGVITHPRKTSTEMFHAMKDRGVKVEMFFIDGQLTPEDIPLIEALKAENAAFVFDDYEGVEKGVLNVAMLYELLRNNLFMQPINGGLAVSLPYRMMALPVQ